MSCTRYLYKDFLDAIPLFRNLSLETITYLCQLVRPLSALKDEVLLEEGRVDTACYFIIAGEVEVQSKGVRLGFLGKKGFFNESSLIGGGNIIQRTHIATTTTDMGYVTRADLEELASGNAELNLRLKMFANGLR